MATVAVNQLSKQELAELACTYAALILHDDGQDVTGEKIGKLVAASNVKIESYWPKLFAKALHGKDITSFFNFGGVSSGPAPAATTTEKAQTPADNKQAPKKQQKKKEAPPPPPKEEQEEMDMGGLFD